ncbi:hypothetical protein NE237_016383 [Protea cynaroides]|uniref:Uncharacterized protein n=1 Tax=Protea cynaroides TaxID=273540 RepID=A0A9Q0K5G2_9MAGN|nr:hypothetical protein NE237_016383 [Protea cynaroides]
MPDDRRHELKGGVIIHLSNERSLSHPWTEYSGQSSLASYYAPSSLFLLFPSSVIKIPQETEIRRFRKYEAKMEVAIPAPAAMDFNFDSTCSSPYISAPSSPKRFGEFYFSAPTSPARVSAIYRDFNGFSSSAIPFDWEEKPGTPKSKAGNNNDDDDNDGFAFDFSGQIERASLSAEDLFDGGVIRPLKPPPRLQLGDEASNWKSPVTSPRSPRSPISQGKKMIREAFSPRQRKQIDPFTAAIEATRRGSDRNGGRERAPVSKFSNSGRKITRSVSPLRVSEFAWEEQQQLQLQQQQQQQQQENSKSTPSISKQSSSSSTSSLKGSKKWRLKDLLLFRSASEGRASEKDPLRKYAAIPKKQQQEDVKNSSFRSTDSTVLPKKQQQQQQEDVRNASFRSTDSTGSTSRRRQPVSAHKLHYTTNRAFSEDMKRKTALPYKQGLLGCLGFNPTIHGLTRSFG